MITIGATLLCTAYLHVSGLNHKIAIHKVPTTVIAEDGNDVLVKHSFRSNEYVGFLEDNEPIVEKELMHKNDIKRWCKPK